MTKFNFLILHSSGQIPGRLSSYSRAFLLILYCALPFTLANCSSDKAPIEPVKRTVETAPVKHPLKTPLPKGMVEAFFNDLDTGGDQMSRAREAGMVLVVRMGDAEYRQTIASCRNPVRSTELGGGNARELEVAMCNGEYWLVTEPGLLQVIRKGNQPEQSITQFKLPDNVRAVSPANEYY